MTAGVAGVDWVRRWEQLVHAREEQWERLGLGRRGGDFWTSRAASFARFSQGVRRDDPVLERVREQLPAGDGRVLDVGAGTGRYAVPLAELGARVVAVEPNAAMADLLGAEARTRGVSIPVEQSEWPRAEPAVGPADVVLCAHVVYPIADIAPFVRALDRAARCAVVMVARLGQVDEAIAHVFEAVHGEPRVPMPALPDLYMLLLQLGFPVSATLHPFETRWAFADAEAAVADTASRLGVAPGSPTWAEVESAVRSRLVPRGDEVLLAPSQAYQAVLWWEAGTRVTTGTLGAFGNL
ncbi:MAG TPA: class I SAM-dependent methyltransferase [Candidatus Dormibacteraeota bacterium]|nr:class I SAM-dependent methyltransferase [Candidatus Dormibacteraeota bacterium]